MAGDRYERGLVNAFETCGWGAMRAPASGGATNRNLPDVLVGRPSHEGVPLASQAFAIELKATSDRNAYLGQYEATDLADFANAFGAQPIFAVWWKGDHTGTNRSPFRLVHPRLCRRTDSNNVALNYEESVEMARFEVYRETKTSDAEIVENDQHPPTL